jgi:HTH-type transcriptional regulator / antitoxin HipB
MSSNARTPAQIGALVHRERRARGLTQAQLGEQIGRRQATISKLERGEPATQLSTLFDVLSALNLELSLVERRKSSKPDIESIF